MSHLVSCSILERSKFGDNIWAWAYPSLSEVQKDYIINKTPIDDLKTFYYGKVKNIWFYISDKIELASQKLNDIVSFNLILWAKDYNPDKYQKLGYVLGQVYAKNADPTQVLKHFISVMTIGICKVDDSPPLEFGLLGNYKKTDVKGLIKMFGMQSIVLYSALLLKKRIIVYHHGLLSLLEVLKSFPSLLPHRKFDEIIFPWFEFTEESLAALKNRRFFVAGCFDNIFLSRLDLTDVLVNIPARELTIAPPSKEVLTMTKIQKDVAMNLEQLAESNFTEEEVMQKIAEKTKEVIGNMKCFTSVRDDGREVLYISRLKEDEVGAGIEKFYVQLATAENILVLDSEN